MKATEISNPINVGDIDGYPLMEYVVGYDAIDTRAMFPYVNPRAMFLEEHDARDFIKTTGDYKLKVFRITER